MSSQRQGDFSDFIYFLAGGTGKKRSNVNLGVNKITSWKNEHNKEKEKLTSEIQR